jgi:hypothetical protein
MRPEILGLETFDDDFAAFQIHPDPVTAESFTHVVCRPAAAKGSEEEFFGLSVLPARFAFSGERGMIPEKALRNAPVREERGGVDDERRSGRPA